MKSQLGRKHHKITIAQWNVRTLLARETINRPERCTALVAMELAKYNLDIAVLGETRFHASGSLNDLEYTFYWSGKPDGERREAGVGFAIKRDIVAKLTEMPHPVSDRIMTMRIPLAKDRNATIVSTYAPTMTNPEENKDTFYSQLKGTLRNIPSPSSLGKYRIGKCNSNGELLLALCTEFDLIVTNTMFKQTNAHKTTWTHPRSRHWHMIDFIITRCRDKMANKWSKLLDGPPDVEIEGHLQYKEKTQSERSYVTRKAEHKQTGAGNGQCTRLIIGR